MRPTIPLGEWRIAVHLNATREIQRQSGLPAVGCDCAQCARWRASAKKIFPTHLQGQMQRVGIEVEQPSDMYVCSTEREGEIYRVRYHAVGRIISGPTPLLRGAHGLVEGDVRMYHDVMGCTRRLTMVVIRASDTFDVPPVVDAEFAGDLLQIDFQALVPGAHQSQVTHVRKQRLTCR